MKPCLVLATVVIAFTFSAAGAADVVLQRLRPLDPTAAQSLASGRERSALFRSLAARIERSDLIVYISSERPIPEGFDGRLQFASATPSVRYLHIVVRGSLRPDAFVATLGHELMHAVELADHLEVRCVESLYTLYSEIGYSVDGQSFDTRAAVEAGQRVLADVRVQPTAQPFRAHIWRFEP